MHVLSLNNEKDNSAVLDFSADSAGRMWIATQRSGLHCYYQGSFSRISVSEGLLSVNIWPVLYHDGRLYIGTLGRGLNILSLEEVKNPEPQVRINKPVITENNVHLSWIAYSYWGRIASEKIETRFRLDEGPWSAWTTDRELHYEDLAYGPHTLRVQVKGIFARVGKEEATLDFVVPAPYYLRPYFLAPVILAAATIILLTANLIIRKRRFGQELRRINAELEQKIAERTEELVQALAKEKELSDMKSRFVTLVSHEFRTPLSVIQSSAELLQRYEERMNREEKNKYFFRIANGVRQITELMNDVLFLGRAEAGKLMFTPEPLSVENFCLQIIDEVSSGSTTLGVDPRIRFSYEGLREEVMADRKLLRPILLNLLSNALKYSLHTSPVYFEVRCQDAQLVFCVRDHGVGIPQEDIPKVFDVFYRAANVETVQGTGLGMAITKECVELHGGSISVRSTPGSGTEFTVEIPLAGVGVNSAVGT